MNILRAGNKSPVFENSAGDLFPPSKVSGRAV